MFEAAKELMDLVKHAPEYTMWVLLGILFYKIFIIGSWIAIAKLLINRLFNWLTLSRTTPKEIVWDLGDFVISNDAKNKLVSLLREVDDHRNYPRKSLDPFRHQLLYSVDIDWMSQVLRTQIKNEIASKVTEK